MDSEDFKRTIVNFEMNFSKLLIELLDKLSLYSTTDCEHQMMNMVSRLDHNGFYSEKQRKILANKGNSCFSQMSEQFCIWHYFERFVVYQFHIFSYIQNFIRE